MRQEIYRQVEQLDWIVESIAVGQELPDGDTRIVSHATLMQEHERLLDVTVTLAPSEPRYLNPSMGCMILLSVQVLFVVLREGLQLDDAGVAEIKGQIRNNTTPRHVPAGSRTLAWRWL